MVFEQFYLSCLAQASYLIGSEGVAAVIDPQRDVDQYLDCAHQHGLRIAHVFETHLHADFVSGHRELAERTGAQIYLGDGSGASFPHRNVREGDEISFGNCRLRVLQTPGHTVEFFCIIITALDRGVVQWAVLSGETLFIGDVVRPDLSV
jgi:glyoxylase-like metal-dependent hydrolase (beta-lactamase superfamily II)